MSGMFRAAVISEDVDAGFVRSQIQRQIAGGDVSCRTRIGIPLFAVAMRGVEVRSSMDGLVGRVGEEIYIDGGEFATDEANGCARGVIEVGELQIRVAFLEEGFAESCGIRNERDGLGQLSDFG